MVIRQLVTEALQGGPAMHRVAKWAEQPGVREAGAASSGDSRGSRDWGPRAHAFGRWRPLMREHLKGDPVLGQETWDGRRTT